MYFIINNKVSNSFFLANHFAKFVCYYQLWLDAVVIVVHGILIETFRSTTSRSFSTITLFLNGFIKFVVVSFGSLFIGLFHGIFSTILTIIASKNRNGHYQGLQRHFVMMLLTTTTKKVNFRITTWYFSKFFWPFSHTTEIEPILMIILSYGSYMIAELIGWSGVLSIIACGLVYEVFPLTLYKLFSIDFFSFLFQMLTM